MAYNGSVVLLAITARRYSEDYSLLVAASRRASGLIAISVCILGWVLEVAALTLIPLTLARILNVAGLGILLVLTRSILKEPLCLREILGVGLIALGIAAAGFAPPRFGSTPPGFDEWALLLLVLGSGSVLPYVLRALHRPVDTTVGATAAGLGYALSGIFSKGMADATRHVEVLPLVLLAAGTLLFGLLSFDTELNALQNGYASIVVPVILAVHTGVPILCAPLLFDESWPTGLFLRAVLGGGIFFALLGTLILSMASGRAPDKW